jgi:hypothetical protein
MPDVALSGAKEEIRRVEEELARARVGSSAWHDLQWEHESLSNVIDEWRNERARARLHEDTWRDRLRWWLRVHGL